MSLLKKIKELIFGRQGTRKLPESLGSNDDSDMANLRELDGLVKKTVFKRPGESAGGFRARVRRERRKSRVRV